jgi:hypothetical protein
MSNKKACNSRLGTFKVDEKTINLEKLEYTLAEVAKDAVKANKGNKAAGRRFRLNTIALGKESFLEMRKLTPVK